jgi:hypothetical protein
MIQYALNTIKKPDDKKVVTPVLTQEQIQAQLRTPQIKKPDGYKSSQSSSMKFIN